MDEWHGAVAGGGPVTCDGRSIRGPTSRPTSPAFSRRRPPFAPQFEGAAVRPRNDEPEAADARSEHDDEARKLILAMTPAPPAPTEVNVM